VGEMNKLVIFCMMLVTLSCFVAAHSDPLGIANGVNILFVDRNNTNCSDANTRATALDPNSPWCNPAAAGARIYGGDLLLIRNGTYYTSLHINSRILNGSVTIQSYPGDTATLTSSIENIANATATWTQIRATPNIYKTTTTCNQYATQGEWANNTPFFPVGLYPTLLNTSLPSSIYCNASADLDVLIRFNDSTYNPNGKALYIANGTPAIYLQSNDNVSFVIANLTIKYSYRAIYLFNQPNVTIKNVNMYHSKTGIQLDSTPSTVTDNILIKNNTIVASYPYNDWYWIWGYYNLTVYAQPTGINAWEDNLTNVSIIENDISGGFDNIGIGDQIHLNQFHIDNNTIHSCADDNIGISGKWTTNSSMNNNYLHSSWRPLKFNVNASTSNFSIINNVILMMTRAA
jgi:hypothetical protein